MRMCGSAFFSSSDEALHMVEETDERLSLFSLLYPTLSPLRKKTVTTSRGSQKKTFY